MRRLIVTKKLSDFRCVFDDIEEYAAKYKQLQKIFGDKREEPFFAEPVVLKSKDQITWYTDLSGDIRNLQQLSDYDRSEVIRSLQDRISRLYSFAQDYSDREAEEFINSVKKFLEIPTEEAIFAVRQDAHDWKIALTQWGLQNDTFNPTKGLIKKLIPEQFFPMVFHIVDAHGKSVEHEGFIFSFNGQEEVRHSDQNGLIDLGKQKVHTFVRARWLNETDDHASQLFICDGRDFYTCTIHFNCQVEFRFWDSQGHPLRSQPFLFACNGHQIRRETGESGEVRLTAIPKGSAIDISSFQQGEFYNGHSFIVQKKYEAFDIVFDISPAALEPEQPAQPLPKPLEIQLLYNRRKVLSSLPLQLTRQGEVSDHVTDANGMAFFTGLPQERIRVDTTYKKKNLHKSFLVKEGKGRYIIHLQRFNPLWLLLLLLGVFLLPVPNRLKVTVMSAASGEGIDAAEVRIDARNWLLGTAYQKDTLTDASGITVFDLNNTFLIVKLLSPWKGGVTSAKQCFQPRTKSLPQFGNSIFIPLEYSQVDNLPLQILHALFGGPIPDAKVSVAIKLDGSLLEERSDLSDLAGHYILQNLPYCAEITVITTKEGFYPDTTTITVDRLEAVAEWRKILLKPLIESVEFFAKSLENRQGLPGTLIKAEITNSDGSKAETKTVGNIDGGFFLGVTPNSTIMIHASHTGYSDTILTVVMPDVLRLTKDDRTLFLRPKTDEFTLTVVDDQTDAVISNAQVAIFCNGERQRQTVTNSQGVASFGDVKELCNLRVTIRKEGYLPEEVTGSFPEFKANPAKRTIRLRRIPPPDTKFSVVLRTYCGSCTPKNTACSPTTDFMGFQLLVNGNPVNFDRVYQRESGSNFIYELNLEPGEHTFQVNITATGKAEWILGDLIVESIGFQADVITANSQDSPVRRIVVPQSGQ